MANQIDYHDPDNYETSPALPDPETGEIYWRARSKDGRKDFRITERSAEERKWRYIQFPTMLIGVPLVVIYVASKSNDFMGWVLGFIATMVILFGGIPLMFSTLKAILTDKTFEKRFIADMKYREKEARIDMQAIQLMQARGAAAEQTGGTPKVAKAREASPDDLEQPDGEANAPAPKRGWEPRPGTGPRNTFRI